MPDETSPYVVGSVGVEVGPTGGETFFEKFVQQAAPSADKAGKTLGDTVAKPLSDKVSGGVQDGIDKGTKASAPKSTKGGDESGGKFADAFRKRVEAALKALPDAKINGDSSDAERKIADVRAALAELSTKRVGIDIDEADAFAELEGLRAELDDIGRQSPSVRVRADTAAASAELAIVEAQVDKLSTDRATVDVDVDAAGATAELGAVDAAASGSIGSLGALATAGILLGPAIVPSAAAAATAVAGIGAAITGVIGGAAVVGLAIVPVVGAIQAMSQANKSAAQSSQTLASRQSSLAGAADQVKSAQAGLANTVANAADAQRRAAETVRNAEQSLADAQRQAKQAQDDLTQAREAEVQAEQDLSLQIADGALAQRQALLDVQKAKADLDATLANPTSSQLQRQQAQLTYDQAVQQVTDLGVRQQRLVAQQQQAQKVGVDGSAQVVAAQQRVAQSQEQIQKAEQAVADARAAEASQARQSAFSIAQAQQSVISAQRALQQATVQTATAGGAAADTLKQKLAALTPEGQKFATFLYGLRPVITDLEHAAEDGFLPGAQAGIEAVLPLVPSLTGAVGGLAHTVGDLAAEAGRTFTQPYWVSFFHFLDDEAGPTLVTFTHSAENVATGLAGIVRAGAPLANQFGAGLLTFTQRFANYSQNLEANPAFQQFLAYAEREGPIVVHTIGDLADATGHLVVATAPIGGFVLTSLRAVSDTIRAIPTPVLTVLVGAIVAVVAAQKAWDLATDAHNTVTSVFTKGQQALTTVLGGMRSAYLEARTATSEFGAATSLVQSTAGAAKTGLSSLVSYIGGPFTIGLAAATIIVAGLVKQHEDEKNKVQSLEAALTQLSGAYRSFTSDGGEAVKSIVQQNAGLQELILNASRYGISVGEIVNAVDGNVAAQHELDVAYDQQIKQLNDLLVAQKNGKATADDYTAAGVKQGANLVDLIHQRENEKAALDGSIDAQRKATDATDLLTQAQDDATSSTKKLTPAQQALGDALNKISDSTATASDKVKALKDAEDAISGAAQEAADANEAYAAATDKLGQTLEQNRAEINRHNAALGLQKGSLDLNSQAARDDTDALKDAAKATVDAYNADIASGVPIDQATKKHDDRIAALVKEAQQNGINKQTVQALVDTYGQVPTNVKTQITVAGADAALTQLENLEIAQLSLRTGIPIDEATKEFKNQHKPAGWPVGGLAVGGPVIGPGGPTADAVPAVMPWGPGVVPFRLSNGEHVWTAAEVQAAGGHGVIEAMRRAVLAGGQAAAPLFAAGAPGYSGGGAVTWPFPVTAAITRIPSLAEVQSVVQPPSSPSAPGPGVPAGSLTGLSTNVTRWANTVVGVLGQLHQAVSNTGAVLRRINFESGGSPTAVNRYDSNWAKGTPSVGLMQVIGPTFREWAGPYKNTGPFLYGTSTDAAANVYAGANYAVHRYGSLHAIDPLVRPYGYDDGGWLPPDLSLTYNGTGKPEAVLTDAQWQALAGGRGSDRPNVTQHIHTGQTDGATLADMIGRRLAQVMG